jgi:hypothetical protein
MIVNQLRLPSRNGDGAPSPADLEQWSSIREQPLRQVLPDLPRTDHEEVPAIVPSERDNSLPNNAFGPSPRWSPACGTPIAHSSARANRLSRQQRVQGIGQRGRAFPKPVPATD